MHRDCFVWTPTPPLSRRRTSRPGPAGVCLCVLFLAGSRGLASRARFGAPHLSCGRFDLLLCSAPSRLGLPDNGSKWGRTPPRAGKPPGRVSDPPLSLNEYMKKYKGCWVCYGMGNSHQHDHTKCAVYAADKKKYFKLHPERVPKEKRIQNW